MIYILPSVDLIFQNKNQPWDVDIEITVGFPGVALALKEVNIRVGDLKLRDPWYQGGDCETWR